MFVSLQANRVNRPFFLIVTRVRPGWAHGGCLWFNEWERRMQGLLRPSFSTGTPVLPTGSTDPGIAQGEVRNWAVCIAGRNLKVTQHAMRPGCREGNNYSRFGTSTTSFLRLLEIELISRSCLVNTKSSTIGYVQGLFIPGFKIAWWTVLAPNLE